MHFETRLLIANTVFLLTYGGVKVWDYLTYRDHVRELAGIFFRHLRAKSRAVLVRHAEEWVIFRKRPSLLENLRALALEFYWVGLVFFLAWLPTAVSQMQKEGAKYDSWAGPAADPQYRFMTVTIFSYLAMLALVRMMQSRCTPPQ